jgi:hypothetical protein
MLVFVYKRQLVVTMFMLHVLLIQTDCLLLINGELQDKQYRSLTLNDRYFWRDVEE